jgi:hypothetical protein
VWCMTLLLLTFYCHVVDDGKRTLWNDIIMQFYSFKVSRTDSIKNVHVDY